MASLASLAIMCLLSRCGKCWLGSSCWKCCFINYTGDMTVVFFYFIFQTSAGFSYARKVAIFFMAGLFVDYVLF